LSITSSGKCSGRLNSRMIERVSTPGARAVPTPRQSRPRRGESGWENGAFRRPPCRLRPRSWRRDRPRGSVRRKCRRRSGRTSGRPLLKNAHELVRFALQRPRPRCRCGAARQAAGVSDGLGRYPRWQHRPFCARDEDVLVAAFRRRGSQGTYETNPFEVREFAGHQRPFATDRCGSRQGDQMPGAPTPICRTLTICLTVFRRSRYCSGGVPIAWPARGV
jgi:hypothetical protein